MAAVVYIAGWLAAFVVAWRVLREEIPFVSAEPEPLEVFLITLMSLMLAFPWPVWCLPAVGTWLYFKHKKFTAEAGDN